jgi:dipeptidyl aminopeptidase/acylaminoacyl peptidase
MTDARTAPYGSWKSPITTDLIVGHTMGLGRIVLDGEVTYWVEQRPWEGGRSVIVRRMPDGATLDVTPPGFSVGTRVHEYGTRGYTVADGVVYFSNFEDQRLYRVRPGEEPVAITPEGEARYGGMIVDRQRNRIICIREDHATDGEPAVNEIVAVDAGGESDVQVLVTSNDFYSSPRLSPDGTTFAWLTWNHPNMPWDGTELWVAPVTEAGLLEAPALVAGGVDEAVMQPEWSPEGTLYFLSDRSGWANLYRWKEDGAEPVLGMEADFAKTHWWVGMSSYGFESEFSIICSYVHNGAWTLARLPLSEGGLEPFDIPYPELGRGDLQVSGRRAVFEAGSPVEHLAVLEIDLSTGGCTELQLSSRTSIDAGYISMPEEIEFPTENGLTAHAFYYPPTSQDFVAPAGEKPPLMVTCHGGPHDAATIELDPSRLYWTSRGIGVVDVNYGGSTGYGRAYRERLIGEWGVVDVDDAVNAAKYLIERGDVDANRVVISGGSAGGYTALAAMTFRDLFKAGASHFGVSDLEALLNDIHKFDTFSLVGLVGPYPLYRRRYVERSPINYVDQLNCPVIFFQGLEDAIVPPEQSEAMYRALREKGIPTAYVPYEGEYHGFTQAENIKRTLEAELYFYSRVFGFELADKVKPVRIDNLWRDGAAGILDRLGAVGERIPHPWARRDGSDRVHKLLAAVRRARHPRHED